MDPETSASFADWLAQHAKQRGPQIALRQKLRGIWASWSWRALDEEVSRMQQALGAHGLGRGERLLIQCELCPELIVLSLAAERRGAGVAFVEDSAGQDTAVQDAAAQHTAAGGTAARNLATRPRFVVVRDTAALAELHAEPATRPAFELCIVLSPRGLIPGAQPGIVLYDELLREERAPAASTAESGIRARWPDEREAAYVATAEAIARQLGDDVDHDALALGSSGAEWQFQHVVGPWLLLGFRLNLVENTATADYDRRELGPSLLLGEPNAYRQLAERVHASLPPPGSWLRRALDRLLDARSGSLYAWLRPALVLRPLHDVLGVSRVRQALVLGVPPEAALSSELRRLGIAIDIVPKQAALPGSTALDGAARDTTSSTRHPAARAVA